MLILTFVKQTLINTKFRELTKSALPVWKSAASKARPSLCAVCDQPKQLEDLALFVLHMSLNFNCFKDKWVEVWTLYSLGNILFFVLKHSNHLFLAESHKHLKDPTNSCVTAHETSRSNLLWRCEVRLKRRQLFSQLSWTLQLRFHVKPKNDLPAQSCSLHRCNDTCWNNLQENDLVQSGKSWTLLHLLNEKHWCSCHLLLFKIH